MSLDRRLRDELHRHASAVEVDAHRHLETVLQNGGRRARWPGALVGVATAVLLLAAVGAVLPLGGREVELVGTTWTVSLDPEDPGAAERGMSGAWTLRLDDRATMVLTAPDGYTTPSGGPPDGYLYAVDGAALTTNLFSRDHGASCAGPGTFAWSIEGDRLTFAGDDTCEARGVLLETRPWTAAP